MEETFVLVVAMGAVSFVVVPFLGWGISDPAGQWETVQAHRRGGRESVGELADEAYGRQRTLNVVALVLWLTLLVALFRAAG